MAFVALLAIPLTVLALPPVGWWPLAAVMLAPLVVSVSRLRPAAAFGLTWLYLTVVALVVVRWFVHALTAEYGVPAVSAWGFTGLLVGSYAALQAAPIALFARLGGRTGALGAPFLFASLWVLGEWLRSGPAALPWLLSAHALVPVPAALQLLDLGGVLAVGFFVVALNAGIGVAILRQSAAPLFAPTLLAFAAIGFGMWRMDRGVEAAPPVRVGVIQAAVSQSERFRPDSAIRNTAHHAALTRDLVASETLDLVVWSETSVDDDIDRKPQLRAALEALARETGVPLVTGVRRSRNGDVTNTIVLLDPESGLTGSYDKQRLVPFSESDPEWLSFLGRLIAPVSSGTPYVAGHDSTPLRAPAARLATPICFEITYPGLLAGFRREGAELVVNLSNDAWFGRGGYGEMHLAHAILRAVELRTWVVRGANTGISAVIDPWGRVTHSLPTFEEGTIVAEVQPTRGLTPYARFGDAPTVGALVLLVMGLLARRGPREGGPDAAPR